MCEQLVNLSGVESLPIYLMQKTFILTWPATRSSSASERPWTFQWKLNPFRPEFTIVIFIHYKKRIAVAILEL